MDEKLDNEPEFNRTARIMYSNQLLLLDEILAVVKINESALQENFTYLRECVDDL